MLDLLSVKSNNGEIAVNLAERYLAENEWGLAKKALEDGLLKGGISDIDGAIYLLTEICDRLDIKVDSTHWPVIEQAKPVNELGR